MNFYFKSVVKGEVKELTSLIYEAREQALKHIKEDARNCGADRVVGVKTYVYDLGGGIIEFMAIGTAVKKMPGVNTSSQQLLPQAIIRDRDTFINTIETSAPTNLNETTSSSPTASVFGMLGGAVSFMFGLIFGSKSD